MYVRTTAQRQQDNAEAAKRRRLHAFQGEMHKQDTDGIYTGMKQLIVIRVGNEDESKPSDEHSQKFVATFTGHRIGLNIFNLVLGTDGKLIQTPAGRIEIVVGDRKDLLEYITNFAQIQKRDDPAILQTQKNLEPFQWAYVSEQYQKDHTGILMVRIPPELQVQLKSDSESKQKKITDERLLQSDDGVIIRQALTGLGALMSWLSRGADENQPQESEFVGTAALGNRFNKMMAVIVGKDLQVATSPEPLNTVNNWRTGEDGERFKALIRFCENELPESMEQLEGYRHTRYVHGDANRPIEPGFGKRPDSDVLSLSVGKPLGLCEGVPTGQDTVSAIDAVLQPIHAPRGGLEGFIAIIPTDERRYRESLEIIAEEAKQVKREGQEEVPQSRHTVEGIV